MADDRFFSVPDKNEHFGPPDNIEVFYLPPENVFWQQLPDGHALTFDGQGLPNGTQLAVDGAEVQLFRLMTSLGLTQYELTLAMYANSRGQPALLSDFNAKMDALVISESVTLEYLIGRMG